MNNKINQQAIERLSILLDYIASQSEETDRINSKQKSHRLIENNNLFSQQLFNTESDLFSPYVKEVKTSLNKFKRLSSSSKGNDNKEEFAKSTLIQIEQQISSLMSALGANKAMHQAAQINFEARKKVRIKHATKATKQHQEKYDVAASTVLSTSHQLYQQLSEHHEFERRLLAMISEREHQRQKHKYLNNQNISQEVLVLHQRLGRCRKAISAIERNIELAEKGNFR